FCQDDAKTDDHYFKGFPSYWNIMVYYMFIMGAQPWLNFLALVVLSALVFVPIKYVYPTRTAMHKQLTMTLAILWGVINVIILMRYPLHDLWLLGASFLFVLYYMGLSFDSMWLDRRGLPNENNKGLSREGIWHGHAIPCSFHPSSASARTVAKSVVIKLSVVIGAARHSASHSARRAGGPQSATSSTSASGTANAAACRSPCK
ncbi:MAG: hypothetical protein KDE31_10840, partial [Caldilineaceae bacterium]|nr:hypothetical protein [Caldilineaceae bacterium]